MAPFAQSRPDALGRISVPAAVRRRLSIGPGGVLESDEGGETIVVVRVEKYSFAEFIARSSRRVRRSAEVSRSSRRRFESACGGVMRAADHVQRRSNRALISSQGIVSTEPESSSF